MLSNPNNAFQQESKRYLFLIILSTLYTGIMLANAILTHRFIGTEHFFILGGALTTPFILIFDDIVAEIFGYKIARNLILGGYVSLFCFVIICQIVLLAPKPSIVSNSSYNILGHPLLKIVTISFVAYMIANMTNIFILSQWKILVHGNLFWLRSIGSSIIVAIIWTSIADLMMEFTHINSTELIRAIILSVSIKLLYFAVLAAPMSILVDWLKKTLQIDIYDKPSKLLRALMIRNP